MPRSHKQQVPTETPAMWFGRELRRLRKTSGMAAKELGRLVQVSSDVIYAVETARYPSCQLDLAKRLDHAFDTGGLFERAWPMAFATPRSDKSTAKSDKA